MTLARKAVVSAAQTAAGTYAAFTVNFAVTLVLARLVAPEVFGVYAIAAAACEIVFIPTAFSFGQATIQLRGKAEALEDTVLVMSSVLALGLAALAALAAFLLQGSLGSQGLFAFSVLAVARALGFVVGAQAAALEGEFRFDTLAATRIGTALVSGSGVVALAWLGADIEAVVAREALPAVVSAATFIALRRRLAIPRGRRFSRETARRVLRVGAGWFVVRGAETLFYRLDQLLLAPLLSAQALGLYWQARYLALLPSAFVAPATLQVALRTYGALEGRAEAQRRIHGLTRFFILRLMVPTAVAIALFPEAVLWLFYGERWLGAAPLLAAFAPWLVLVPLFESTKTLLLARHRYATLAIIYAAANAVIVAVVMAGAPGLGALAAAFAHLASMAAMLAAAYLAASPPGSRFELRDWYPPLASAAVVVLVVLGARTWLVLPSPGWLAVGLAVASALASAAVTYAMERRRTLDELRFVVDRAFPASEREGRAARKVG